MGLEDIKVDMGKLNSFIGKFEKKMASTPCPYESSVDGAEELSPMNMLTELKKIKADRRITTELQEQIYRILVMGYQ